MDSYCVLFGLLSNHFFAYESNRLYGFRNSKKRSSSKTVQRVLGIVKRLFKYLAKSNTLLLAI